MDKLRMQTANKADENFRKLAAMFPNAVTETINENGEVVRAIDKDVLMQEISCTVVDGNEERYQFTWPDKKKSVLLANAPINKTLRPCREESVDFDTTENLYIEGDNLEVLNLLQETYLGKVKMIYIDIKTLRKLTSIVYKTGVLIRFFIFFMSCLTAMMPLGCHIGDLWGKQEERRPGILKSGGFSVCGCYENGKRTVFIKCGRGLCI